MKETGLISTKPPPEDGWEYNLPAAHSWANTDQGKPVARDSAVWVPPGSGFVVNERRVPGGMVYFGTGVESVHKPTREPAVVDPTLPIDWSGPYRAEKIDRYWPAYHRISPRARAAYLSWLAAGRHDPDIPTGYVFLFYAGVERRLLHDLRKAIAGHPETLALLEETERLRNVYSHDGVFVAFADNLLGFVETVLRVRDYWEPLGVPPGENELGQARMEAAVKYGLGMYLKKGEPIPGQWALRYAKTTAGWAKGQIGVHPEMFDELFLGLYEQRYGQGIAVKADSRYLRIKYRPASGGFEKPFRFAAPVPDVDYFAPSARYLDVVTSECLDRLSGYRRHVQNHPDSRFSASALESLPAELVRPGGSAVHDLERWLESHSETPAVAPVKDVFQWMPPGKSGNPAKASFVKFAGVLGKLGWGIEPDFRYGGTVPRKLRHVVLFPLAKPAASVGPVGKLPEIRVIARLLWHVTDRTELVNASMGKVYGLGGDDSARLGCYLKYLIVNDLGVKGMKRQISKFAIDHRQQIGGFLVDVATSGGLPNRHEVAGIVETFEVLGLSTDNVYDVIHEANITAGPVTVRPADPEKEWKLPPKQNTSDLALDPSKVRSLIAETARASEFLGNALEDPDETNDPASQVDPEPRTGPVEGLDSEHTAFLRALTKQETWNRETAERLAGSHGLMFLDGALDIINEAVFDTVDDLLIDNDEPITINRQLAEELLR